MELKRRSFLKAMGVGAALLALRPKVIINRGGARLSLQSWDEILKKHYPEEMVLQLTERPSPFLPGDKVVVDDGRTRFVTYVSNIDRGRGIITFDTRPV